MADTSRPRFSFFSRFRRFWRRRSRGRQQQRQQRQELQQPLPEVEEMHHQVLHQFRPERRGPLTRLWGHVSLLWSTYRQRPVPQEEGDLFRDHYELQRQIAEFNRQQEEEQLRQQQQPKPQQQQSPSPQQRQQQEEKEEEEVGDGRHVSQGAGASLGRMAERARTTFRTGIGTFIYVYF